MNSTQRVQELLQFIKQKQTSRFDELVDLDLHTKKYQDQNLIIAKQQILNSSFLNDQSYQFNNVIEHQKKLATLLNQLIKQLADVEQLFKNGLEENCLIQGVIGLQNLGTYMLKEFEILKALQKPKHLQSITKSKQQESLDLQNVFEEKKRIEILKTLLFIKQKVANEKLKHMRESIYSNEILIYDYGNVKKINQINSKLQIDGPVIQKQLQDRLFNIKKLISQKIDLEFFQKQSMIDQSKQQQLIHHRFAIKQLQQISGRADQVKQFITGEYQMLNLILQQLKGVGFDYLYNTIHENKNIIEYEKQLTKPLTFIESDSLIGQLFEKSSKVIDIEQVMKQIRTWCKNAKIVTYNDFYPIMVVQCLEKLRNQKFIPTNELDELRQLFIQIQKL